MLDSSRETPATSVADRATLRRRIAELEDRVAALECTEQALKESERRQLVLSTAIDQAAEMIYVTESDGTIVYVNPAFERVTGFSQADAIGKNPRLLKSGEHDRAFYEELWGTITSGRVWYGRFVNSKKDGTLYHEEATISPVRGRAGQITHFVAVKRDVSRETELEHQLHHAQKMESIGRLAGGVAHDFNNLLSPIFGYAEMLLHDGETGAEGGKAGSSQSLNEILKAADRAKELTNQLLAFSRKQVLEMRPVDLSETVGAFRRILRRMIREDVHLEFHLAPDLGTVHADPGKIELMLMNLAVNAQDALPAGGKVVVETAIVDIDSATAEVYPDLEPGPHVVLRVSDNGTGMSEDVRERAFEPFFTTKARGKGTGLGLSTVHGIVKQHGGEVCLESRPGRGTTFDIFFPRLAEGMEEPVEKAPRPARSRGHETVLVVEDDEMVRRLVGHILGEFGYRVLEAANGEAALERAERHPGFINLLLTDVVMPGMNGRELCERLRQSRPNVAVLYMSGYADETLDPKKLAAGNGQFIAKPISVQALTEKVRAVLESPA